TSPRWRPAGVVSRCRYSRARGAAHSWNPWTLWIPWILSVLCSSLAHHWGGDDTGSVRSGGVYAVEEVLSRGDHGGTSRRLDEFDGGLDLRTHAAGRKLTVGEVL